MKCQHLPSKPRLRRSITAIISLSLLSQVTFPCTFAAEAFSAQVLNPQAVPQPGKAQQEPSTDLLTSPPNALIPLHSSGILDRLTSQSQPSSPFAEPSTPAAFPPLEPAGEPSGALPLTGHIAQTDYCLGAGDVILLQDAVMGTLLKEGRILPDGSVHLPLIGKVLLADLSMNEARQHLTTEYTRFFTEPRLTLRVLRQHPARIYVTGAVENPGVYTSGKDMRPETLPKISLGSQPNQVGFYRLHLTDALIMAGGLSPNANAKAIRVHRAFPKPSTLNINLISLFEDGHIHQDLVLRDQDVVEVAEIPENSLIRDAEWEEFSRQNVNTNRFTVSVLGAVSKPGMYEVNREDSVLTAVAKAGGFSEFADKNRVFVLHSTPHGQVIKREVNMRDRALIGRRPIQEWASVLPHDVVFVDASQPRKGLKYGTDLMINQASAPVLLPLFNSLFGPK